MQTQFVSAFDSDHDSEAIVLAADYLRAGKLVAFATETVYGLGCDATNPDAVAALFEAKGRPPNNPLIVHVGNPASARQYVSDWPQVAEALSKKYWPGPLTLVLRKNDRIVDAVCAGGSTVGVRVPSHPIASALIRAADRPIAAPSANRSETISPTTAHHVLRTLRGRIDMVLDSGPTPGGLESTVVDVTRSPPILLRPGLVSIEELRAIVPSLISGAGITDILRSPGMMPRHYAPSIPLEIHDDPSTRIRQLIDQGKKVGVMAFDDLVGSDPTKLRVIVMPKDPKQYAQRLYAVLHELDQSDVARIIVAQPPNSSDWLAIQDRLRRAAQ